MADAVVTRFTADTSGLERSLQEILDKIGALENKTNASAQSIEKLESASAKGASGIKNVATETKGLVGHLENLSQHTDAVGGLFSALGGQAGPLADKLSSLSGAFSGLTGLTPALMGVGAAIVGIGAAAAFIGDAAVKAGEWQQKMAILGQTVRNQGGDWKTLSSQVQAWADLQERTTTFSHDEAVQALTKLTATGMSLGDAMKVTRVAEDAAAATGKNLMDVENGLMEAMHGRTQALTALGLGTKQSIHDGMKFNDVLALIEKSMGGAAAQAANTFPGALTQLKNSWESLMQDAGTPFLNLLTGLVKGITGFVQNLEERLKAGEKAGQEFYQHNKQFIDDLGKVWEALVGVVRLNLDGIIGDVHAAWDILAGLFTIVGDALTGHWNRIWGDIKSTAGNVFHDVLGAFGNFGDDMVTIAKAIRDHVGDILKGLFSAMAQAAGGNLAGAATTLGITFSGTFAGLKLKPLFGNDALSGGSSDVSDKNAADINTGVNTIVGGGTGKHGAHHKGAHSAAAFNFHEASSVLDSAAAATKSLAHANAQLDAELKNTAKSVQGYQQQIALLTPVINNENNEVYNGQQHLTALAAAAQQATDNYNAYGKSLGKHPTKEEAAELKQLKVQMDAANKNYTDAKTKLDALTASLQHHRQELATAEKGVQSFSAAWDAFTKKQDANEQASLATAQMTNAQKYAYYQQAVANITATDQASLQLKESLYQKELSAYTGMVNDELNARKQEQAQERQLVTTFLDDILSKHMSFKDAFKNVWDDIVKIFITDIEKMIVESQIFKSIFGNLGVGGSFNPLGAITGMFGGSALGGANSLVGTPGAVATSALHVNIAGISPNAMSGAAAPTGGLGSIMPMLALGAGIFGMGSSIGNLISGGGPGNTHGVWGGLGALAGGVGALGMMGIAAGGGFTGLMSAAGLAALGPAGWGILLGGAVLGGLAGGLFGHKDNPANMPDKYDTQNYGTIIADLMGSAGANGQHFTEQSSLSQAAGGKTGIAWIEETLAKYANPDGSMGSNTPDWLKPMWNQLVGAFGISSTGSGQLNFGHAINNEWITGAQGVTANSNNPMQYTQLGNLLNQFYTAQQQGAQSSTGNIPIFSLQRMAPDFNTGTFVAWSATTGTSGGSTRSIPRGMSNVHPIAPPKVEIHLDNGIVVGHGGMQELADKIELMLQRNRYYNFNNTNAGGEGW